MGFDVWSNWGIECRMISEELRATLAKHDQQHLLKYYDAGLLTEEQKASLESQVHCANGTLMY